MKEGRRVSGGSEVVCVDVRLCGGESGMEPAVRVESLALSNESEVFELCNDALDRPTLCDHPRDEFQPDDASHRHDSAIAILVGLFTRDRLTVDPSGQCPRRLIAAGLFPASRPATLRSL